MFTGEKIELAELRALFTLAPEDLHSLIHKGRVSGCRTRRSTPAAIDKPTGFDLFLY